MSTTDSDSADYEYESNDTDPLINGSRSRDLDSQESLIAQEETNASPLCAVVILFTNMCEYLATFSIVAGVVLFCTSSLEINQDDASTINQIYTGFVFVAPVLGGFLADSHLGRYRAICMCGILYVFGLALLPASAVDFSTWGWTPASLTHRRIFFFTGLVLIVLGGAGVKSNLGPFGAEQIKARGRNAEQSFFNWFYWTIQAGSLLGLTVVPYVQQEISFVWGFFVAAISWMLGLLVFISCQSKYKKTRPTGSIFTTAFGICGQGACKNPPEPNPELPEGSERKFLARSKKSFGGRYEDSLVDYIAGVVKVTPFCLLMIMFWTINAQRMDIRVGGLNIPAAALNVFNCGSVIILIPVVDKLVYPFFKRVGLPLSQLWRIGIGMVLAAICVIVAGVIEIFRKRTLHSPGGSHIQVLAGETFTASNFSVFYLVPQYVLVGLSEIFAAITAMDFVYNQTHVTMQGLLTGIYYAAIGIGNWLSSALLSIVSECTKADPWWNDDINTAKMENLMFLMAGLMFLNLVVFCVVGHFYTYQDPSQLDPNVDKEDKKYNDHDSIESSRSEPLDINTR